MNISLQFILALWLCPMPINLILAKRLKYKMVRTFFLSLLFSGFLTSALSWKILIELSQATAQVDATPPLPQKKLKRSQDRYSCFLPDININTQKAKVLDHLTCTECGRKNRRDDDLCFSCGYKLSLIINGNARPHGFSSFIINSH